MAATDSTTDSSSRASVSRTEDGQLVVSGVLDFSTVNTLLEDISRSITNQGESTVDLGGVEQANSAGLALMAELKATAIRGGRSLVFRNVPASLRQVASVCQVDDLLLDTNPGSLEPDR